MTKGIQVKCQCCGTDQDITTAVSHEIFGLTLAQLQHIVYAYREQIPPQGALELKVEKYRETSVAMMDLMVRHVQAHPNEDCNSIREMKAFLEEVGALNA